jgi:hypothetical protein
MEKETLERFTNSQHEIWSHWMKFMFSKGTMNEDGTWTMDKEKVERWKRQMETDYNNLSEDEKETDRKIVVQFIYPSLSKEMQNFGRKTFVEGYTKGWDDCISKCDNELEDITTQIVNCVKMNNKISMTKEERKSSNFINRVLDFFIKK